MLYYRREVVTPKKVLAAILSTEATVISVCVLYAQGLLRELYKVQGHSSSATVEWDWGKFESPSVSGGADHTAGDVLPATGCGVIPAGQEKVCGIMHVPAFGQDHPTEAKAPERI